MSWLDGNAPVFLAGGGGPRAVYSDTILPPEVVVHETDWRAGKPKPWLRGEGNGHAKLSAADVAAIHTKKDLGYSCSALAREYGVARRTIQRTVGWQAWTHIDRSMTPEQVAAIPEPPPEPVSRKLMQPYGVRIGHVTPLRAAGGRNVLALCHLCNRQFETARDRLHTGVLARHGCNCRNTIKHAKKPAGPMPKFEGSWRRR